MRAKNLEGIWQYSSHFLSSKNSFQNFERNTFKNQHITTSRPWSHEHGAHFSKIYIRKHFFKNMKKFAN
jgi:hypothetical protein